MDLFTSLSFLLKKWSSSHNIYVTTFLNWASLEAWQELLQTDMD